MVVGNVVESDARCADVNTIEIYGKLLKHGHEVQL
jgi:hypothetical protein